MAVVAGLDFFGELGVEQAVLESELGILLHKLFNLCLIKLGPSVMLQDLVLELVTSEMEFRAHFRQLEGPAQHCIIVNRESLNLIRVAFGVKEGDGGTLA